MIQQVKLGLFPWRFQGEQPETALWVAGVVSAGGTVSAGRRIDVNTLIAGLKGDGVWAKLDRLWLFAAENTQSALLDLIARDTATPVNSPTFTADDGYTFNGSNNHIDTTFNPTSDATNYLQDSASAAIWCKTRDASVNNAPLYGAYTTGTDQSVIMYSTNAWWECTSHNASSHATTSFAGGPGFIQWSRSSSTAVAVFGNGGSKDTYSSSTTSGIPNCNLYIGARNNNGGAGDLRGAHEVSAAVFGGYLTDAEVLSLYNRMRTYMTAVGVP